MTALLLAIVLNSVAVMVACIAMSCREHARVVRRLASPRAGELGRAMARQQAAGGFFL